MCTSRAPRSVCAAPTWASTLRMRSVAAIANTPSANVSNRFVVILSTVTRSADARCKASQPAVARSATIRVLCHDDDERVWLTGPHNYRHVCARESTEVLLRREGGVEHEMGRGLPDSLREGVPRALLRRQHIDESGLPRRVEAAVPIRGLDASPHLIFGQTLRPELLPVKPRQQRRRAALGVVAHRLHCLEELPLDKAAEPVSPDANPRVPLGREYVHGRAPRDFRWGRAEC